MLIKVSELTDETLDRLVAKCVGPCVNAYGDEVEKFIQYSRDWVEGGPIIEREKISLRHDYWENGGCRAFIDRGGSAKNIIAPMYGPTSLIAAMRCYVASKLGDEIEIPEQLK